MSHVIDVDCEITNLLALKWAAESCGPLEMEVQKGLVLGQDGKLYDEQGNLFKGKGTMKYRTWIDDHGGLVGDWPVPDGMKAEEVGKNAVAVIRIKGDKHAYEIGVIPKPDGTYSLCHDFYGAGRQIEQYVGHTQTFRKKVTSAYDRISMHYQAQCAKYNCIQNGVDIEFQEQPDGSIMAVADTQSQGIQIAEGGA